MKNTITIAAVAGLAVTASGQVLTIEFSASDTTVTENATVTWTMTASWTGAQPDGYLAAMNVNLIGLGSAKGTASPMIGLDWANPSLGTPNGGAVSGTSLLGLFGAQQHLFADTVTGSPLEIGRFDVAYNAKGDASYGLSDPNANPAFIVVLSITLADLFGDLPSNYRAGDVLLITDTVIVTPAPSALTLLVIGSLMARRRRL